MPTKKQFEIAIVGGGITGVTLAIALHARQIPVTLYEQAPKFGEIGAGVSFGPNAVQAMKSCHQGIYEAYERVCTRNVWPSKQKVWFDYLDGYDKNSKQGHQEAIFTIYNSLGQNGVHRAHFLDEMVKLIPQNIARFDKRLDTISENSQGRLVLNFLDGTTAEADAVVGCDGIKSRVRQLVVEADHPSAYPSYSHKHAYRGLVPMEKAMETVGEERAQNSCMHLGRNGHILTFPVNHGKTLNLVAFRTSSNGWPDAQKLTRQGTRAELLEEFKDFGPNVLGLLKLTEPELDVWGVFDLGDNPPPTFYKGRVLVSGDAAHASSPHHGAGAGLCIEDSAVLTALLADERVNNRADLEAVFATFDACRRERGQWLVQSSRFIGDCYQRRAPGVGDDFAKIERAINTRNAIITNVDVNDMCTRARDELGRRLVSPNL